MLIEFTIQGLTSMTTSRNIDHLGKSGGDGGC